MDLGNIVYIVAVLAYFIYQATRKKKLPEEDLDMPEGGQKPPKQEVSFEDLLREIRGEQEQQPKPKPKPKSVPKAEPKPVFQSRYEEQMAEKESKPTTRYKTLEEMDNEIQYYEGAFQNIDPTTQSSSKGIPDIQTVVAEPEAKRSSKRNSKYAALLKDPTSVKEALVLKEILTRKHF